MLPPFVTDVKVASQVVQFLRSQGMDVVFACEEDWGLYCHQKRPHSALRYLTPMEFQQQNSS